MCSERRLTAPRLLPAAAELSVPAGADVCLPCVASDQPAPHYTWYREWAGRLQPVEVGGGGSGVWWWAQGAALCLRSVTRASAGAWLCKAYNVFGDATAHARLHVTDALRVTVAPLVLVADTGSTVRFNCSSSEAGASLSWLHDGAAAGAGAELVVRGVARAHRGAYQCFARLADHAAHATAELRLGDSAPELHYTFIEQALRLEVLCRCAAPRPDRSALRFTWLLDDQPLDQYRAQHRYFISQESSANGDVVSVLNMTAAAATDGGRYTCRAHNQLGRAAHSARLNIYGKMPPR
ncbi:Down syndrome cell adhesion molecule-like protein Dscam2 [Manduca sexta]|uniref:Down syndrome cell adhesion molecule-like protein Dscam2 n=1 Tax=Manduca sexta TaxID=7130 RepID=UPI00188E33F5|nr:Down syndrome cell adhesion molecule-like protein Dscam2 [Manduca sexta]